MIKKANAKFLINILSLFSLNIHYFKSTTNFGPTLYRRIIYKRL